MKLINQVKKRMMEMYMKDVNDSNNKERLMVLADVLKNTMSKNWSKGNKNTNNTKEVHYFSMEFLLGRQLKSVILNLGMEDEVKNVVDELGWNLDDICEEELDPSTGNGGLGRLAACFIDSMSSLGMRGYGEGLRYKYGLFKQLIVNGEQKEIPDMWLDNGSSPWDIRQEEQYIVKIRGNVRFETIDGRLHAIQENYQPIVAVPYDMPVPGYQNNVVNYLRLWNAEVPPYDILDKCGINYAEYNKVIETKRDVESICDILYPNDATYEGKELRLKQEYFLCSAGLQSLISKFKKRGVNLRELDKYLAVHINDTHPTLCIPEFMRILVDEENFEWDEAWSLTNKVMSYTNHTIMQEALEKWPETMMQTLLPRIYMIIQEIDRRYVEYLRYEKGYDIEKVGRMKIIGHDGNIHMANLCCMASHSINGVAALHTDILKAETLRDYYKDTPWKFNNKTNGITHRRWLISSNPDLTLLIDDCIGNLHPEWKRELIGLDSLNDFADSNRVLTCIDTIKYVNKNRLAQYIKRELGITVNPNSIFDVQVKRLHAYKRQLMNALGILMIYNDLIDNPDMPFHPMTFVFGAKSPQGYHEALCTIKLINKIADKINNDTRVNDKIKVVFIPDYNVSKAEIIIPAADISEQISTASKEASGTSNMKFALNGALTLGTMDGANVEIRESVGDDNIFIFGISSEEAIHRYNTWTNFGGKWIADQNPKIKRAMEMLINGEIPGLGNAGNDLYWTLMNNDQFFVLTDLQDYVDTKYRMNKLYRENKHEWNRKCLINIANMGNFTTDRTIAQYRDEIWYK